MDKKFIKIVVENMSEERAENLLREIFDQESLLMAEAKMKYERPWGGGPRGDYILPFLPLMEELRKSGKETFFLSREAIKFFLNSYFTLWVDIKKTFEKSNIPTENLILPPTVKDFYKIARETICDIKEIEVIES